MPLSLSPSFTLFHHQNRRCCCCCCCFISKSPGGYAIYHRNARVLEMQNFTPAYMKRWTYVRTRTDDFLRTKISRMIDNQVFLPMVLRYYRQIGGVAMGSRLGPNYVCLFMGHIEEQGEHPICTSGISTTLPEPSLVVDKRSKILLPLWMVFIPV